MIESASMVGVEVPVENRAPMQQVAPLDPSDVRAFSLLMDGSESSNVVQSTPSVSDVSVVQKNIVEPGMELSNQFHAMMQEGKSISTTLDKSDPFMYMAQLQDFQFRSTLVLTNFNLTSGVTNAMNGSFNSLLKNQG